MSKVKTFKKGRLSQDEIQELIAAVVMLAQAANFAELAVALAHLESTLNKFKLMIHPLVGNELTSDILDFDTLRDKYFVGFCHYIEFALRHNEPEKVAAAQNIDFVLNQRAYKGLYDTPYRQETGKIKNLLEELHTKCAADMMTLNISSYVQALEDANNNFFMMYENRNVSQAQKANTAQIRAARTEMEQAFDMFAAQLNLMATLNGSTTTTGSGTGSGMTGGGGTTPGMGGGTTGGTGTPLAAVATTFDELIDFINQSIERSVEASNYHQAILQRAKAKEEAENNGTTTPENTTDNSGENGGENNGSENEGAGSGTENGSNTENNGEVNGGSDNGDPNQGNDNTPSANA